MSRAWTAGFLVLVASQVAHANDEANISGVWYIETQVLSVDSATGYCEPDSVPSPLVAQITQTGALTYDVTPLLGSFSFAATLTGSTLTWNQCYEDGDGWTNSIADITVANGQISGMTQWEHFLGGPCSGPTICSNGMTSIQGTEVCLAQDAPTVSLSSGGSVTFDMDAGPMLGNRVYWLLGTFSGTSPGFFSSAQIPLNYDVYTQFTLSNPNSFFWIQGSLGFLDSMGRGTANLNLIPGLLSPILSGLILNHAYVVFDDLLDPLVASNTPTLTLTP